MLSAGIVQNAIFVRTVYSYSKFLPVDKNNGNILANSAVKISMESFLKDNNPWKGSITF